MTLIALKGAILVVLVNAPLILYLVWSWRLLKRQSEDIAGERAWLRHLEVWSRLLVWSVVVSILWPLFALILGLLYPLLAYNAYNPNWDSAERVLAQVFLGIAYLPVTIANWIADLLPGIVTTSLPWVLLGSFIVLFLATSVVQWLLIIRSRHMNSRSTTA